MPAEAIGLVSIEERGAGSFIFRFAEGNIMKGIGVVSANLLWSVHLGASSRCLLR